MQEQNLDVNIIIQSFQEKINQLTLDSVIKDATIKQLNAQIEALLSSSNQEEKETKKDK